MNINLYKNFIREIRETWHEKYSKTYYKCDFCEINLKDKEDVERHLKYHFIFDEFKKYFFNKRFEDYYNLAKKYAKIIGVEGLYGNNITFENGKLVKDKNPFIYNKKFYCRLCGMRFKDWDEAFLHIVFHGTACYEQWIDYIHDGKDDVRDFFENYYNENYLEDE